MHDKMLGGAPLTGSAQRSSRGLEHVCDGSKLSVVRGIEHTQAKIVAVGLHREIVPGEGCQRDSAMRRGRCRRDRRISGYGCLRLGVGR